MEQNSPVGTKAEKNNLIVGALILFIGIVIGGVFGGGVLNSVDDANLQGQAIESQEVTQSDSGKAQWSDVQIEALKNIKEVRIITGKEEDLKTAFNIDVNALRNGSQDKNAKIISELMASETVGGSGNSNNPNPDMPTLACYTIPMTGNSLSYPDWWEDWGDCVYYGWNWWQ